MNRGIIRKLIPLMVPEICNPTWHHERMISNNSFCSSTLLNCYVHLHNILIYILFYPQVMNSSTAEFSCLNTKNTFYWKRPINLTDERQRRLKGNGARINEMHF